MTRITYLNGQYVAHENAMVHIEDRGFQLADGVYEVIAFHNGRFLDGGPHLDRLEYSLRELEISMPLPRAELETVTRELLIRNDRREGNLYLQVTRGVAPRVHSFPKNPVPPTLIMYLTEPVWPTDAEIKNGVSVITLADQRWARPDIKSISLLPNVLAKEKAVRADAKEAVFIAPDGATVREGSSTNAFMVDGNGVLVTHPANGAILGGITRNVVLAMARKEGMKTEERTFTLADISTARECFLTGTTTRVLPIVSMDGKPVCGGKAGPVAARLYTLYMAHIAAQTGDA